MNKLSKSVKEIHTIDQIAREDRWVNHLHPLVKLCLTIGYIAVLVATDKYAIERILLLAIYPFAMLVLAELSMREALRRLRIVIPLVCAVGIFNPFFDHSIQLYIGNLAITGGILSMITLMGKGCLAVFAGYFLIASTTIEKLCYALRRIHVPSMFVTVLLLSYRYISVLLSEASRMIQAYELRAPGQKGVHFRVWGSMIGQLLLRSMDRAQVLYESMRLRGFDGEFREAGRMQMKIMDFAYVGVWIVYLIIISFR